MQDVEGFVSGYTAELHKANIDGDVLALFGYFISIG